MWGKFEPVILGYRARSERSPIGGLHGNFEDLYYSMEEESRKFNEDLQRKLLIRADRRKTLGLKPIVYPQ